jgi:uncharacterized membrane protein
VTSHVHLHASSSATIGGSPRRVLVGSVVVLMAAAVVGLVLLWPDGTAPALSDRIGVPDRLVDARVVGEEVTPCIGETEPGIECSVIDLAITSGPEDGRRVFLDWTTGGGGFDIDAGDRVRLGVVEGADVPPEARFYFADFQRQTPLLWLGALFALAVVALGRFRGVRALVALVVSLLVLTQFVLPSILEGHSPVAVAIVGSAVILVSALYLSHGMNLVTTSALLGTLLSLGLTGLLAVVFVEATSLTGLASEEATFLQAFAEQIDARGLLLGGIIIGSLGVLDDVTVTQASAVWELRQAIPDSGFGQVYRAALRIGRDHIASAVNTLVLAYAGASLPLLILFTQTDRDVSDVLTSEVVGVEIVRTLVGSIGLVASVPLTTALTAFVVTGARLSRPSFRRSRPQQAAPRSGWRRHRQEQAWREDEDDSPQPPAANGDE